MTRNGTRAPTGRRARARSEAGASQEPIPAWVSWSPDRGNEILQEDPMTARFTAVGMMLLAYACVPFLVSRASGQLAANQTHGFGNGRLVTFTYQQNFDCVDQPTLDLDFNGIPAQSDPNEMQTPICQPITEPTADPTGGSIKHTAHLYVLIPMS